MHILSFAAERGRIIEQFASSGTHITPIARFKGAIHIGCFHLQPDALIGRHPASVDQVLLVLAGNGFVAGAEHAVQLCNLILQIMPTSVQTRQMEAITNTQLPQI